MLAPRTATVAMLFLPLFLACRQAAPPSPAPVRCGPQTTSVVLPAESRPFAMGFSRWPPDATTEAVAAMDAFLADHADLTLMHFDNGVPWPEALAGEPFSDHVLADWRSNRAAVPPDHRLFVAITPINMDRDGLAPYRGARDNQSLPEPWRNMTLDHPDVLRAYLNYARRVVESFDPDYLAVGIEVNLALLKDPQLWEAYVVLHGSTYAGLKAAYPDLPILASVTLPHLRGEQDNADPAAQQAAVAELIPSLDILGLSVYPYSWAYDRGGTPPEDYFEPALAFGKPLAVTETGMPTQDFTAFLVPYRFEEEHQTNYIGFLLRQAAAHEFAFVVNWANLDFDRLVDDLPIPLQDLARTWAYTGLQTSDGCAKPALSIWDAYLDLPLASRAP